jgi:hypothetical protein
LAEGIHQLKNLLSSGDDSKAKSMVQNNFANAEEVFFQTLNVINIAQSEAITVSHIRTNSFSKFLKMCFNPSHNALPSLSWLKIT